MTDLRAGVQVGGESALLWLDTDATGGAFYLDAAECLDLAVGAAAGRVGMDVVQHFVFWFDAPAGRCR